MGEPDMPVTEPSWDLLPMLIAKVKRERVSTIPIRPSWPAQFGYKPTVIGTTSSTKVPCQLGSTARQKHQRPAQESALVSSCIKHKIRCLEEAGANENARDVIIQAGKFSAISSIGASADQVFRLESGSTDGPPTGYQCPQLPYRWTYNSQMIFIDDKNIPPFSSSARPEKQCSPSGPR